VLFIAQKSQQRIRYQYSILRTTRRPIYKTCHFIFDHNFHVSWWIFAVLVWRERGTKLQRSYKIYNL